MKQLLETGMHFGHRTTKWNPKMRPFIFTERNGIHIIDLQQTLANLNDFYDMVRDMVSDGKVVLFLGTKRQAQEAIVREAERAGMPYINTRWLGGTLTNWRTIRERIDAFKKLEKRRDSGEFELLPKKEVLILNRKIEKLQERLGGIRNMRRLPDLILVIDTQRESTALKEANALGIPVMALADTNSDPDEIDFIIPGNDDAVRAIKLILAAFADACVEGAQMRKGDEMPTDEEGLETPALISAYDDDAAADDDSRYFGASTIAKLKNSKLFDEDEEESQDEDGE
ncbi:MAG: 30S ribosomal protein S2 [Anaerolineae bacterium]|nr:30S ribosomal protein S2 [Anaerolineae bacterium]